MRHVQGEVHEDVDAIRADHLRRALIVNPFDIPPVVTHPLNAGSDGIRHEHIRVAEGLDVMPIMLLKNGQQIRADDMSAKIGRHIPDAQSAGGRRLVRVRRIGSTHWFRVLLAPFHAFREEVARLVIRVEARGVDKIAMPIGSRRIE